MSWSHAFPSASNSKQLTFLFLHTFLTTPPPTILSCHILGTIFSVSSHWLHRLSIPESLLAHFHCPGSPIASNGSLTNVHSSRLSIQNPALTSLPCLETDNYSSEIQTPCPSTNAPQIHSDHHFRVSYDPLLLPKSDACVESPQSCKKCILWKPGSAIWQLGGLECFSTSLSLGVVTCVTQHG